MGIQAYLILNVSFLKRPIGLLFFSENKNLQSTYAEKSNSP